MITRSLILISASCFTLSACTGNYQHVPGQQTPAEQMRALGNILIMQDNAIQASCSSIDIPPIASPGCQSVCINGRWAEVC